MTNNELKKKYTFKLQVDALQLTRKERSDMLNEADYMF
jgi:hypothetical protein